MKILLIDMDGVLSDYYGAFVREWKKRYPTRVVVEESEIKDFYLELSYPKEYERDIRQITTSLNFFNSMDPVRDSVQSIKKILEEGEFDPYICTTPDTHVVSQMCWSEKAQWIEKFLGPEWNKRLIETSDKTMVRADYLIDDKPVITGKYVPEWTQVTFDQAYNRESPGHRLYGWSDWKRLKKEL